MNFEILLMGSDANAYYMARCYHEIYNRKAYLIGCYPLSFTKYSNILNIEYVSDIWKEKVFLNTLKKFRRNHSGKIILISTNETYTKLITKNKNILKKDFIFHQNTYHIINSLINKEKFYKTYKNGILDFPKTYYYNFKTNKTIPKNLSYPIILKPSDVITYNHICFKGKNKIYKINTEKELRSTIDLLKANKYKHTLIIQEFIPGNDDMLFDCVTYSNQKGKVEFMSFAQIGLQERTQNLIGNAAILINGFNTTKVSGKIVLDKIKDFLNSINYKGFAEVDLKFDYRDKKFKILEINARQGRSSYYISKLGKNPIKVIIDDLLYSMEKDFEYLDKKVYLSFVPKSIAKKYITNKEYKNEIVKNWNKRINPVKYKNDKNFLRILMLKKRNINYYKEYKNSYWRD